MTETEGKPEAGAASGGASGDKFRREKMGIFSILFFIFISHKYYFLS